MASVLRQIVAGPRARHPEAGLDLCYVTDSIIVTSGPSSTYPQKAYRNPTDSLVKFLDYKHGENWAVWEFRAEGTGYPDSEVYGRVRHYPWPDHHPPPFALIPNIMASMRNWMKDEKPKGSNPLHDKKVVVVHCKAGKGRSGTVTCSYLISEEGWKVEDALARFTEKRMRPGFGSGVSIPSQLRWVGYVDRWTKTGKTYIERPVEIIEIHAWGLREGVKVSIEGYVEEGRKINVFHTFTKDERIIVDDKVPKDGLLLELAGFNSQGSELSSSQIKKSPTNASLIDDRDPVPSGPKPERKGTEQGGRAVILRPKSQVILPTSDVCIDVERRNRATYGWTMVTAVAHVWFNVFFEGDFPEASQDQKSWNEQSRTKTDEGVFELNWEQMDGLKGSSRKGTKALDKIAVVWRAIGSIEDGQGKLVIEPPPGEEVPQSKAADWSGKGSKEADPSQGLGLRVQSPQSQEISPASSIKSSSNGQDLGRASGRGSEESLKAVKSQIDSKPGE